MAWPPPVPPNNRANTTPSFDNHATDHNMVANALAEILAVLGIDPAGGYPDVSTAMLNLLPIGTITMFGSIVAPSGWLLCEGGEYNRTTYPLLFSAIGTSFGPGNGSTTANLPDLRGRFPVGRHVGDGAFAALNQKGGAKDAIVVAHTHSGPSHSHPIPHTHPIDHNHSSTANDGLHNHVLPQTGMAAGGVVGATPSSGATSAFSVPGGSGGHSHGIANFAGTSGAASAGTSGLDGTGQTGSAGVAPTDGRLPPYISMPFIIRAGVA